MTTGGHASKHTYSSRGAQATGKSGACACATHSLAPAIRASRPLRALFLQATIEITSRYAGVIRRVHHSKGSVVKVGLIANHTLQLGVVPGCAALLACLA